MKVCRPGIVLGILTPLLYAFSNALSAFIISTIGYASITGVRYIFQPILVAPCFYKNYKKMLEISRTEYSLILISGLFLAISTVTNYASVAYIPIMDCAVIRRCQVVFVIIVSRIWLKTQIHLLEYICILFVVIGVFLLSQPEFIFGTTVQIRPYAWIGFILAGISCIVSALTDVIVKKVQEIDISIILTLQSISILLVSLLSLILDRRWRDPKTSIEIVLLLSAAFFGVNARMAKTRAIQFEEAHVVSSLSSLEILFSLILEIILLDIFPNWKSILGASIVVLAVITISQKDFIIAKFANRSHKTDENEKLLEN